MSSEHICIIERNVEYWAECDCGWEGPIRMFEDHAGQDADQHELEHR